MGIIKFLTEHAAKGPVSFHMPGHKGRGELLNNSELLKYDITEIPGADNLFLTEGIIRQTMTKYEKLYDVRRSYLLVNGTSCGLIAAVMASVEPGARLIMSRNCHKSVFNALTLAGVSPVYAFPEVIDEYGISGPVDPAEIERLITANPDAAAVILPSPNYYGICSDIKAIADVVHRHGRILIVDQAHGAHLKMFSRFCEGVLPKSAEESGADIIVNSIHKTLFSLTQSAVLNVNSDRVDTDVLEDKLQMLESTSPSYILMASLDANADRIEKEGSEIFSNWNCALNDFYDKIRCIPGIRIMNVPGYMDATKINIDMSAYGINGNRLEQMLNSRGIFPELTTGNILMCMSGAGNTAEDYDRLAEVLHEIAAESADPASCKSSPDTDMRNRAALDLADAAWTKRRPLHEIPKKKLRLDADKCAGRICASSVIPYPPGIPLVCPGEEISAEDIAYIKDLRENGEKVIGFGTDNTLVVGNDR